MLSHISIAIVSGGIVVKSLFGTSAGPLIIDFFYKEKTYRLFQDTLSDDNEENEEDESNERQNLTCVERCHGVSIFFM